ncbi:GNAT family N-acetyltransferase [Streptomyces rugosispiralis]|uniref:GNAT family N-acetyltransferase n=1 Tax=Streptomyces rugosispiralis TaxID=2967341 RepID=A0ABT1V2N0_9ACTN|nr:GNAT family N-acetyltransferase [Streptomyces rugosispiralis]MCQ8191649.1 GNAT family N-acetyltransferase [Streptomyces rugosispiralis]
MTMTVRDFRATDAEAVAAARRSAFPFLVTTPRTVVWTSESAPVEQHHRLLVAEVDGRVVGSSEVGLFHDSEEPGQAFADTTVGAGARGRGVGSALVTAAEEYLSGLGTAKIFSWTLDEASSVTFAERRGYRRGRCSRVQRLDLTAAELPPLGAGGLPDGVELRTAADFADDPRPLYAADVECTADEPGDVDTATPPYAEWLALNWEHPALDRELTSVAVVDGAVAAYSVAHTDGRGRYWSGMTGTRRAFRGRGLAKLTKNDSLRRARSAGCREAFTGNDGDNGPMPAVNKWFGYEPAATEWRYVRELSA